MRTVKAGGLEFGAGMPKICVPLTGATQEELLRQAELAAHSPAELVEWRVDAFEESAPAQAVAALTPVLRRAAGMPLLVTFRTQKEGGTRPMTAQEYADVVRAAVESGADLVDIELYSGDAVPQLVALAKEHGVLTVVSNHDFAATPPQEELFARFAAMHAVGADLPKLAVMPHSAADVLALLGAARRAYDTFGPVIAVSMGALGTVSRVAGELFGSCVTFGTAGASSAPGQMPAQTLKTVLQALHNGEADV